MPAPALQAIVTVAAGGGGGTCPAVNLTSHRVSLLIVNGLFMQAGDFVIGVVKPVAGTQPLITSESVLATTVTGPCRLPFDVMLH